MTQKSRNPFFNESGLLFMSSLVSIHPVAAGISENAEFRGCPNHCHSEPFDRACPEPVEGLRVNSAKNLALKQ
jgi:hypothetical protein